MLTKDLIECFRRGDRIYPKFVSPHDIDAINLAKELIKHFQEITCKSREDIEDQLEQVFFKKNKLKAGFVKLLFDRCEFEEDDEAVQEFRWNVLKVAESLRIKGNKNLGIDEYQKRLSSSFNMSFDSFQEKLYSDLPELQKIKSFEPVSPEDLIHRYNAALIQGLLIHAKYLAIDIEKADLLEKRSFFRCLKFHQLLAEVQEGPSNNAFKVSLTGPLSIFTNAQTYGIKLANFFPYVLQLQRWQCQADIEWGRKTYSLNLNEQIEIKSHYKQFSGYVPKEMSLVIDGFNKMSQDIQIELGGEFVNVGRESYVFSDLTITRKSKSKRIFIELFHRWHTGQLKSRLQMLEQNPIEDLRIGVCKSILKDNDIKHIVENSAWFKRYGFLFNDFPTPRQISSSIEDRP